MIGTAWPPQSSVFRSVHPGWRRGDQLIICRQRITHPGQGDHALEIDLPDSGILAGKSVTETNQGSAVPRAHRDELVEEADELKASRGALKKLNSHVFG